MACPDGEGPTNGCYWPTIGGECSTLEYWSATPVAMRVLTYVAQTNWVEGRAQTSEHAVRCVTDQ